MSVSAKMLSSSLRSRASRYRGTRLAANGRKRVEMKKNSASCFIFTGLMASAYAAGRPSTRTRNVDPMLANAEVMKYGGKSPESTSWNEDSVGRKKSVGGELAACGSGLSPSIPIHRTGKKKTNTTSQPTTDRSTLLRSPLWLTLIAWPRPEDREQGA